MYRTQYTAKSPFLCVFFQAYLIRENQKRMISEGAVKEEKVAVASAM